MPKSDINIEYKLCGWKILERLFEYIIFSGVIQTIFNSLINSITVVATPF